MTDTSTIVREYERGDSLRKIAERHGISHQTVANRLTEAGVTLREPGAGAHWDRAYAAWSSKSVNVKRATKLLKQHRDVAAVADIMTVPRGWIRAVVAETPLAIALSVPHQPNRQNFSDEDVTRAVKRVAEKKGEPLSAYQYDAVRRRSEPSMAAAVARFGSWCAACTAAGVECNGAAENRSYPTFWTSEAALASVRSYVDHCRAESLRPIATVYRDEWRSDFGGPSLSTIEKMFGSWFDAVWEAVS